MAKTHPPVPVRKPWVRPAVEKIAAGQAEYGNGNASDGTFGAS